jgi:two-component system, LytTR family, sensor kinase
MSRRQQWMLWFGLFTAIGLAFVSYRYLDDLARGYRDTFEVRFIEEMTGAYTAIVVIPLARFLTRRFPWGRAWFALFAAHVGTAIVFSTIHTSLMALTRREIFAALHLGPYDYGTMAYRYPMEFSHDLIVYGVVAGFMYVWNRMREEQRAALDAARLRAELVETRLANLRLQLHPHFLFNSLNAISAVMYEDPRAADTMLVRLSDYLRMTLDASDRLETEVEDELRMTSSYVDIMRARFEQRLRLRLSCEPGVEHALVPSMLLQPLVENAILHGGTGSGDGLGIDVEIRRDGEHLAIVVSDSGAGLPAGALMVEGRGLGATRSRLEQRYGDAAQFGIANRIDSPGTRVDVRLPLHAAPGAA